METKRNNVVGIVAFVTMIIVFMMISLMLVYYMNQKENERIEVYKLLEIEKEKNKELQLKIEDEQTKNEQINLELEELKEQMNDLQSQISLQNSQQENIKPTQRVAYLTFDDGPSENTVRILDLLKKYNVKATFFVVANTNKMDIYKRIIEEGHTLGNHTYGHNYNKIYRSSHTFFDDVERLNDLLEEATGERTKILRFPGGSNNTVSRHSGGKNVMKVITQVAKDKGYHYFDWNVDSQDAAASKQSKDVIVKSVIRGAQYTDHAVILMHDAPAKTTTVDALPEMIEGLTKLGFIFKPITEDTPQIHFQ